MADSIEQKIITAIVDRLSNIDGTGDYLTDIGTRVEDSRQNWSQDELPAISVFQGKTISEPRDNEGVGVVRTLPVMIEASLLKLDGDAENAAFFRKAMADIMRAIRNDDKWIVDDVPLALGTSEKEHGPVYAENTYEMTGVQVDIDIVYLAAKFNLEA